MITFSIFRHDTSQSVASRQLLNDILYRSNISEHINAHCDKEVNAIYAAAYDNDTLIGTARLCLNPVLPTLGSTYVLQSITQYFPEYILHSPEALYSMVCRNSGLAVLPQYRKGAQSVHIGNTLHQLRQHIAIEHKRKFMLMFSREKAWNLAERNQFTLLCSGQVTIEGQQISGRWYIKKVEVTPLTLPHQLIDITISDEPRASF